jgi:hypothetical protein
LETSGATAVSNRLAGTVPLSYDRSNGVPNVPEVIEHSVAGCIVDEQEAVDAVD